MLFGLRTPGNREQPKPSQAYLQRRRWDHSSCSLRSHSLTLLEQFPSCVPRREDKFGRQPASIMQLWMFMQIEAWYSESSQEGAVSHSPSLFLGFLCCLREKELKLFYVEREILVPETEKLYPVNQSAKMRSSRISFSISWLSFLLSWLPFQEGFSPVGACWPWYLQSSCLVSAAILETRAKVSVNPGPYITEDGYADWHACYGLTPGEVWEWERGGRSLGGKLGRQYCVLVKITLRMEPAFRGSGMLDPGQNTSVHLCFRLLSWFFF